MELVTYTEGNIFLLDTFLWNLLKRVKDCQRLHFILPVFLLTWNILLTKIILQNLYTWNTSLFFARTVGIIKRYLKFFDSLRIFMTFEIFLNLAQGFTFRNSSTIDMVTLTSFFTVRCDDRLVRRKCLIVILT